MIFASMLRNMRSFARFSKRKKSVPKRYHIYKEEDVLSDRFCVRPGTIHSGCDLVADDSFRCFAVRAHLLSGAIGSYIVFVDSMAAATCAILLEGGSICPGDNIQQVEGEEIGFRPLPIFNPPAASGMAVLP